MKLKNKILTLLLITASSSGWAQESDSTGLPGDNFSLQGALELFKKSDSPEAFEKMLNDENNKVNNLDLNGDDEIDYIRVIDKQENDLHAFIMQAIISENESQDIAVIEVEKNRNDDATLQIIGDEDIYGKQTIIEPTAAIKSNAGTKTSNVVVNVYTWPTVRYVYAPGYRVWVSPWGWQARPVWWRPWRPVHYHVYHGYHRHYHPHYVVVHRHRTIHAHRIYRPARTTSVTVRTKNQTVVQHYRSNPRTTRTRTSVNSTSNRSERVTHKEPARERNTRENVSRENSRQRQPQKETSKPRKTRTAKRANREN